MNKFKKLAAMAMFGLLLLPSIKLMPTSWQTYDWNTGTLTVHYGNSAKSAVCFSGLKEDYPGDCTSPTVRNPEYEAKRSLLGNLFYAK